MYLDIEEQIEKNFTKIYEVLQIAKWARIFISNDSNSRSKAWHDKITNSRGKKLEEYMANRHLHIIYVQNENFTFHSSRGFSNIYLTITNNNLRSDCMNGISVKKRAVQNTISLNIRSEKTTVTKTNTTTQVLDI